MRFLLALLVTALPVLAQRVAPQIPADDAVRIREFYRLASVIEDQIWADWSRTPSPVLLVTAQTEFLTHDPNLPKGFSSAGDEFYARPRQFHTDLLSTFPAFGPPSVIVVGEPSNTNSKTSTPWLITLMHEHFHQLQNGQPRYDLAVNKLGLNRGDNTGMWMLNYGFPYENLETAQAFSKLRDLLLKTLNQRTQRKFKRLAQEYGKQRKDFESRLSADDRKYLEFQLWQEGIARYTQVKCAEAALEYKPTSEFAQLSDFQPFAAYAEKARAETLDELRRADLRTWKRVAFYSFGASEGFMLDRLNPKWHQNYFKNLLSMDSYFEH